MDRRIISPPTVWDTGAELFAQCTAVTGAQQVLYLAGQTSISAAGEIVGIDDPEQQIRLSFENVRLILVAAGATLADVVKLTVYFTDLDNLPLYTRILGELYPVARPSQTVVQVARLALPELLIEIDATAVV
jgi:enamine deaminase RidA (YjgF/YER057c/UK114 family)